MGLFYWRGFDTLLLIMRAHNIFFWATVFFLAGVLLASITGDYWAGGAFVMAGAGALYLWNRKLLALLALAALIGVGYYFAYDSTHQDREIIYGQKVEFSGVVKNAEQGLSDQKLRVDDIQISAPLFPLYAYGDKLDITGKIKPIPPDFFHYFDKEGIHGLMTNPDIAVLAHDQGSPVKAALLKIKDFFEQSFRNSLPGRQAAFLSGLLLGDTAKFDDSFKEDMRLSGTSHLVALSGFNISIIVIAVTFLLDCWWLTRRFKFPIAILLIGGFVAMTGAAASSVRAAILAGLVLLAEQTGRVFYFRNAVAVTALVMVAWNPKVLAFDIGFQLSFAALLGIVYLAPLLKKWLRLKDEPGFLNWREHLTMTAAAQLAVLPLLVWQFGYFSPMGIISNLLILEFIPLTMALGFILGVAASISGALASILSWPALAFLSYEMAVIHYSALAMKWLVSVI